MATIKKEKALDVVRQMVEDGQISQEVAEKYFPELKESENKRMIQYFKDLAPFDKADELYEKYGFSHKDAISWLEKQGGHAKFINGIQVGDKVTRNEDGVLVNLSQLNRVAKKQGEQKLYINDNAKEMFIRALERVEEQNNKGYKLTDCDKNSWWEDFKAYTPFIVKQKSAWSEKHIADVFEKVGLVKVAREQSNDNLTNALQDAMIELSKFTPQHHYAWSEEDEMQLDAAIHLVSNTGHIETANWLKSLRPQKQWKPTKQQIVALRCVLNHITYNIHKEEISGLLEQLKKLRGE